MLDSRDRGNDHGVTIDIVQNIIDYIETNLYEELTLTSIAGQFYLSISSLNNLFKTVCDMTIMEYARNRRLSLAGQELMTSNIHIIDLAFKYGYETPEAFSKAFTRFHGFPPSFIRRAYPKLKVFNPLKIKLEICGGWENIETNTITQNMITQNMIMQSTISQSTTNQNDPEQEENLFNCYDRATNSKGGLSMYSQKYEYRIDLNEMKQKEDWRVLLLLSRKLDEAGIKFKVDGKTMIFAHGLEFKLEKICLTFKWNEEQRILKFFGKVGKAESKFSGFKYFDTSYEGMKVRCMFYGECPGDDTDELLFRNSDCVDVEGLNIHVQSLEFYIENSEPDSKYYKMVEDFLKIRG
ncbi:MAG TPA: AraC family transcriptional regulator [Lachnospiraceae bacterium]|nr:AraC family transcriptional regulator [Lachnospiraceae bacterium]